MSDGGFDADWRAVAAELREEAAQLRAANARLLARVEELRSSVGQKAPDSVTVVGRDEPHAVRVVDRDRNPSPVTVRVFDRDGNLRTNRNPVSVTCSCGFFAAHRDEAAGEASANWHIANPDAWRR